MRTVPTRTSTKTRAAFAAGRAGCYAATVAPPPVTSLAQVSHMRDECL